MRHTLVTFLCLFITNAVCAQSDSIAYRFDRHRSHIDSLYFPSVGKCLKVADYNPYNSLKGFRDVGRTPDGNVVWKRQTNNSEPMVAANLTIPDSCQSSYLHSNTHVDGGNSFACAAFQLVAKQAEAGTILYSTIIVFNSRGEVVYRLMHLKGGVSLPCVDQGGHYLTFSRSLAPCTSDEGSGSHCVYDLWQGKFIYDFPADENWSLVVLTDGYVGLMTRSEEKFKRYRVFDFREKLFYDMAIPYDQVAKIKKITRNGFQVKTHKDETSVIPFGHYAPSEKFPD